MVAETRAAALDAAEAVGVDFDELPVHVETAEGGPAIHPEAPGNLAYDWAFGDEAEVDADLRRGGARARGSSSSTTGRWRCRWRSAAATADLGRTGG